ncbi:hypothetical protein P5673_027494 [Acropora cervicornis]|uniref:Uncharacterized protein n=1 Tax=Acropora cervicornis TaxID=6130 RepID=A0AAD9PZ41_ACRCE|nr:hypothetical protein P5673_027494 [Acropora cervicornis]
MLQLTNVEQTSELDHGEPKEWWIVPDELIKIKQASPLADELPHQWTLELGNGSSSLMENPLYKRMHSKSAKSSRDFSSKTQSVDILPVV